MPQRPRPSPRRRRALGTAATGVGALAALVVGSAYGALRGDGLHGLVVALGATAVFLALAVATVRRVTGTTYAVIDARSGAAHASGLALLTGAVGYALTALGVLQLLHVPVGQLLLGGAITGIVLGIAAQQSLGNLAAGLVLLLARPFGVGDRVTVHSGALGGPHVGTVVSSGLTYVHLRTAAGVLQLPNSGVLAAAVGPAPEEPPSGPAAQAQG